MKVQEYDSDMFVAMVYTAFISLIVFLLAFIIHSDAQLEENWNIYDSQNAEISTLSFSKTGVGNVICDNKLYDYYIQNSDELVIYNSVDNSILDRFNFVSTFDNLYLKSINNNSEYIRYTKSK